MTLSSDTITEMAHMMERDPQSGMFSPEGKTEIGAPRGP